jgi:hypothetical protein
MLASESHPDRLRARGVPEEFLTIANDRMAAAQRCVCHDRKGARCGMSAFKPDLAKPDFAKPDFAGAQLRLSPNCGDRRNRRKPDMLVLHYTGMATAREALDWLCVEESQVSSHYFVDEAGLITQMVPEGAACLARGREQLEGRDRRQFRLDRHRDCACGSP